LAKTGPDKRRSERISKKNARKKRGAKNVIKVVDVDAGARGVARREDANDGAGQFHDQADNVEK
jgi:hypothetical protein